MLVDPPEVQFATGADGTRIAYQVVGDGPSDLVLVDSWASSIDLMWEQPQIRLFLQELATVGRLILFDKRGNGASDRLTVGAGEFGSMIEHSAADLLAVLDAAGSARTDIVASLYGGWPSLLFAATHPERCGRLVLQDCCARLLVADDYPDGITERVLDEVVDAVRDRFGEGIGLLGHAPDMWHDVELRRWHGRNERLSVDRGFMLRCWEQMRDIDVRAVLASVRAETLVIAHPSNWLIGSGSGAYLARHIPGARLVELDGNNNQFWSDERQISDITAFLGGAIPVHGDEDRVLATVLFTDLVSSTTRLAAMGDRRWRRLLDEHDRVTAGVVERFRGRLIDRTGDGLLATFDGPARAVRCAEEIGREVRRLGMDVRAGLHAGEIELRGEDVGGIAVHLAARIMGMADAGEVLVSRTVRDLTAGSGLSFVDRGCHELKGIPEPWQVFSVGGP